MKKTISVFIAAVMAATMSSCSSKSDTPTPTTDDTKPTTQVETVTEKKVEKSVDVFSDIKVSFTGTEYTVYQAKIEYLGNDDFIKNGNVKYGCYSKGGEDLSILYCADMGKCEALKNGDTAILKAVYTIDGEQYEEEKEVTIEGLCDVIEDITKYPDVRTEIDNVFDEKINEYVGRDYAVDNIISSTNYINGSKDDKWKITGIDIVPQKTFFGFWGDQSDRNINSYSIYEILYAINLNVEKTESSDSENTDGYNVGDTTVFTLYAGCSTDEYSLYFNEDKVNYFTDIFTYFPSDMGYSTIREMTFEELCNKFITDSLHGDKYTSFVHEIT